MPRCDYCGYFSHYAVCPYDGTQVGEMDVQCNNPSIRHSLRIPVKYRRYFENPDTWTVAACPNCKTPYFYSYMPQKLREDFNRQRQAQGCFIATAALGSYLHPHIQSLRHFRDNILLQSRHKKSFENLLNFYYKFSPPVARAMTKYRSLKIFLRYTLVYPIVFGIKVVLPVCNLILGIEKDANHRKSNED